MLSRPESCACRSKDGEQLRPTADMIECGRRIGGSSMRRSSRAEGISVQAIAGAQSVLLAMNATDEARRDLLGFAIGRRQGQNGDIRWLDGFKFFRELVPNPQPGEVRSTLEHPVQSFLWGIGIGGSLSAPPLPHHRTYGSVYGGFEKLR
jgi:hypothetical protein